MVSISSCFNYNLSVEEQISLIQEVGFESFSISGKYSHNGLLDKVDRLISTIKESGIKVDTIHGCRLDIEEATQVLEKCCYAAKELNTPIIVVHPSVFFINEEKMDDIYNSVMKISGELKEMAKRYNIRFALENLHPECATEVLRRLLDELDPTYFGLCYDITHAQVDGPRECELVRDYGDRIIAVHISDRIREFVDHVVPGEGFIDFKPLVNTLYENSYKGSILIEVLSDYTVYKDPKELLKKSYSAAKSIEDELRLRIRS